MTEQEKSTNFETFLDPKTRELIAISNSLTINCEYCMEHHYAKAKEVGVSDGDVQGMNRPMLFRGQYSGS